MAGSRVSFSKYLERHSDSLPHTEQTNVIFRYMTVDKIHCGLSMTPNLVPRAFPLKMEKALGMRFDDTRIHARAECSNVSCQRT